MKIQLLAATLALATGTAFATPVTYTVDPDHTHPAFEADHFGGLSVWRGLFKKTTGTIVVDKEAGNGTVDITIDTASVDFGHEKLNQHVSGPDMFDTAKFPTATYKGKLVNFNAGAPTEVEGELTLHGVTKPVTLKINSFKCIMHPMLKREVCGADASATINRADFGVNYGQQYGFKQEVNLHIQVEGVKAQ